MSRDPDLPCGHPHDCYINKVGCGWCAEIAVANEACQERDAARREAADERAARRVQAKEYFILLEAAAALRTNQLLCDQWPEESFDAIRAYDAWFQRKERG